MKDNASCVTIKSLPPSSERLPLFIVGDVHGCARELAEIIRLAKKQISQFQLILVGDLFTKGPDPIGVYEQIVEHNAICIKGNHDWALKTIIAKSQKSQKYPISEHSKQTLHLIRYHKKIISNFIGKQPYAITSTVEPNPPHANWEKQYPLIILHAGLDPIRGLKKTTERMLLTARHVRFESHNDENILTPINSWDVKKMQDETCKIYRWHDFHHGPELIVFGHDAKQGLFRKTQENGRPICVGIDTGCTYGKFLTGYFPELDSALQVKAHRVYFNSKENIILLNKYKS